MEAVRHLKFAGRRSNGQTDRSYTRTVVRVTMKVYYCKKNF